MSRQVRPEDALELELLGEATGACPEELVELGSTLRAVAAQIEAPTGLLARRGSIIAAPTAQVTTGGLLRFPRRRLHALLLAATLTAMSAVAVAGAVGSGWLGEAVENFIGSDIPGSPAVPGPHVPPPSPAPTRSPLASPWQLQTGTEDAPSGVADEDLWSGAPGEPSVEPTGEPGSGWPSASTRSPSPAPSAAPGSSPRPPASARPSPSAAPESLASPPASARPPSGG